MRIAKWFAVVLILSPLLSPTIALGQFLTQVSGTVKDPTGLPYSNGTIVATLVISGTPRFTFNSLPYTPPSQPVGLDANGSFVMSLADVNQLTPSGGTWSFHVCSATGTVQPGSPITQGPVCFDAPGFIITGASVNISTQLSAASARLTTGGAGGSVTVTPGTTGQFAIYTNPTTVGGTPTMTTNGTTNTTTVPLGCVVVAPCLTATATPTSGIGFGTGAIAGLPLVYGTGTSAGQILALRVNGGNVTSFNNVPAANFNLTTPAAPANGINVSWQTATGNPATISAALVGDGSTNFLNGQGVYTNSIPSLSLTSTGTALTTAGSISSTTAGSTVTSAAGQTAIGFATTTGASPALVVSYNGGAQRVLPSITINGTSIPVLSQASSGVNFNTASPAAPANGKNVTFTASGAQVSAALVGDGNAFNCFNGTGTFVSCTDPLGVGSPCSITTDTNLVGLTSFCTFTLPAVAKVWTLDCRLQFNLLTGTTASIINIAVTNTPNVTSQQSLVLQWTQSVQNSNTSNAVFTQQGFNSGSGGTIGSISGLTPPQTTFATFSGVFPMPATAGSIQIQANVAAGGTGTVMAGSWCKLQ